MTLIPRDTTADRLREASAARLEQEAVAASRDWYKPVMRSAVAVLRDRATEGLVLSAGGAAISLLTGYLSGRGLAITGLLALGMAPLFLLGRHRFIPRRSVAAAPRAAQILPSERPRLALAALYAVAGWGLFALLLLIFRDDAAAHLVAIPLATAVADGALIALTLRWERRHDRELLIREDDGDTGLYTRPRITPPRAIAGLPLS